MTHVRTEVSLGAGVSNFRLTGAARHPLHLLRRSPFVLVSQGLPGRGGHGRAAVKESELKPRGFEPSHLMPHGSSPFICCRHQFTWDATPPTMMRQAAPLLEGGRRRWTGHKTAIRSGDRELAGSNSAAPTTLSRSTGVAAMRWVDFPRVVQARLYRSARFPAVEAQTLFVEASTRRHSCRFRCPRSHRSPSRTSEIALPCCIPWFPGWL